jgi:hypothetical protein
MTRHLLMLALTLTLACAGAPRARLVQTHQTIQTALAALDDAERRLCWNTIVVPDDATRCTTAAATAAGLTPERHQAISRAFIKAYRAQLVLGDAIALWTQGAVIDLAPIEAAARDLDLAFAGLPATLPSVAPLLTARRDWQRELDRLTTLVK